MKSIFIKKKEVRYDKFEPLKVKYGTVTPNILTPKPVIHGASISFWRKRGHFNTELFERILSAKNL